MRRTPAERIAARDERARAELERREALKPKPKRTWGTSTAQQILEDIRKEGK